MNKYKVDHNGSCQSKETDEIYTYIAGVSVELPEDVAAALGRSAHLIEKAAPAKETEQEEKKHEEKKEKKEEEKEVKQAPRDKMVKGGAEVTKK